ncbi:RraA family protein [Falsirhodobacter halotolerans]|uniref:RraA family protein n=1 Tax=Falsirhodobacter halotolerans TaxID=1146892 RepID=UPI001FD33563|nr:RraA family protein [Falsirhodobacter halotolerans]MCJ8139048.1 RraA family protein [Falsirhodobacter halotolerans]
MSYKINPMPEQIPQADLDLLAQCETATMGHWRQFGFLSRQIQPLIPRRRVVGTAVTIAIPGPDSTLLHHLLSLIRPGDFVIVDRLHDDRYACWGGGVTVGAKAAGAVGAAVDGPCTDLEEIEASDFPMWCRGISPITTRLYDIGGAINVPVSCGNTVVMPGDAVLADESGVLVLPRDEVASEAQKAIDTQARGKGREGQVRAGEAKLGDLSGATARVMAKLA